MPLLMGEEKKELTPQKAFNLLVRYLNNPCPGIARRISKERNRIDSIAREYEKIEKDESIDEIIRNAVKLFLTVYNQVSRNLKWRKFIQRIDETFEEREPLIKIDRSAEIC